MNVRERVGLSIKTLRVQRGLTQEQLAEGIDRSVDGVSNLERGKSLPNFETLERLSAYLNVPIRVFFEFEEERISAERLHRLLAISDVARALDDGDLDVALNQIKALAKRKP